MSNNDLNPFPTRLQILNRLVSRFNADYKKMLQHYSHDQQIELTGHLIKAVSYIRTYHQTKKSGDWKAYADAEKELLKKYRSKLQHYADAQFYMFFDFRLVLAHKDILTQEQFNSMKSAKEQSLSDEEISDFLADIDTLLSNAEYFLYLNDKGETAENVTLNDTVTVTDEPDKEMTKARQLLAIYFFLKASLGIEARDNNSASGVARFIHLITGTKFTTIQNSDIYKKYLRMPNYKKDKQLIEDLKYIRPYFTDLGVDSAVSMIDEEMRIAINELPVGEKKKYREM